MILNIKLKRTLKTIGILVAAVAIYAGAAAWYVWKWESPHDPLPEAHLDHRQHTVHDGNSGNLADAANQEMIQVAEELQSPIDKQVGTGLPGLASPLTVE